MKNLLFALSTLIILFFTACETIEIYTVTASSGVGGTISPSGKTSVSAGDSINYTITPAAGNAIQSIKVDGIEQPVASQYKFKNVTANHEIKVEFIATYAIKVTVSEGGTVSPTGTVIAKKGETVTFTFTPQVGFVAYKAIVDGVVKSFTNNSLSLVADNSLADKVIDLKVEFVDKKVLLISQKLWYFVSKEENDNKENSPWIPLYLVEGKRANAIISFDMNGKNYGYYENGEQAGGSCDWSISGDDLILGDSSVKIIQLDENKLVYVSTNSGGWSYRYTYIHK